MNQLIEGMDAGMKWGCHNPCIVWTWLVLPGSGRATGFRQLRCWLWLKARRGVLAVKSLARCMVILPGAGLQAQVTGSGFPLACPPCSLFKPDARPGGLQQIEQTIGGVKEQCDRDLQAEASLQAAADAHQRALAERDQTVRRLAAENSLAGFAGTGALSEAALSR